VLGFLSADTICSAPVVAFGGNDMKSADIMVGVGIGVLLTAPTAFLAVMSAGAGHGHYEMARLFFPYTMLLTRLTGDSITSPLIVLALMQFPLYGAVMGAARSRFSAAFTTGLVLAFHIAAAAVCFSGAIPNFS
jgi:hypothetical protein